MPILRFSLIRVLFASLAFLAAAAHGAEREAEQADAVQVMEELAAVGIKEALKAIGSSGGFYPFAFLRMEDGQVNLMGFEGDLKQAPDADDFAKNLHHQIRLLIRNNPQIEAAAIFRVHMADDKDGQKIPGVWCLVDHRDRPAMIVFQPLVRKGGESGELVLGDLIYQKADEPMFVEPGDVPEAPAD